MDEFPYIYDKIDNDWINLVNCKGHCFSHGLNNIKIINLKMSY